jgi:poly [ADP-ribose] polymerase
MEDEGSAAAGEDEKEKKPDDKKPAKKVESILDPKVQDLVKLICDVDMMKQQMIEVGYDAKKLPLGKLSKTHIEKGYNVLKRISDEIEGKQNKSNLLTLSNEFYTLVRSSPSLAPPTLPCPHAVSLRRAVCGLDPARRGYAPSAGH